MTCHEARESLSALLDEALTPDERRAVEAHLEGCAECRRELERLRQTVGLLHRVVPAHAPVGFVDRVTAAARPRPWYRRIAAAAFLPLATKLPAGATALVMVALLAVYTFERTPELQQAARYEAPPSPATRLEPSARLADERKEAQHAPGAPPAAQDTRRTQPLGDAKVAREARRPAVSPPLAAPAPPSAPPAPAPPPTIETPSTPGRQTPAARPETPPAARPETPPAARSEPPPARRADEPAAHADAPAESVQRSEAPPGQKALERAGGSGRVAPAAPGIAAKRARPSADVVVRVAVRDRDAAERELAQLIARVGGRQTERRRGDDATVVEAVVPQSRYAEFSQALASIGSWRVESERPDLPSQVHVILRLE